MKAFIINGPKDVCVKDVPYPKPTPSEVVIKVERAGICGTDFHIYSGEYIANYPIIPGHEFSGTIVELGANVSTFQIGDRVSCEPNSACGHCKYCVTNRSNHCENWEAVGVTRNGAMAEYVAVPFQNVFKLPDHLNFGEGAFLEPMACVVHGLKQASPQIGSRVLLIGAGAMGQQLIQGLSHLGVSELIVSDLSQSKLEIARKNGATTTLLPNELDAYFANPAYSDGVEIVVDVTGIPKVIENAFKYLGYNGTFLQFGVTPKESKIELNPFDIFNKDWKIVGSMATNQTFHAALQWVSSKRLDVDSLISRVITLEELEHLFENGLEQTDLKVQIQL